MRGGVVVRDVLLTVVETCMNNRPELAELPRADWDRIASVAVESMTRDLFTILDFATVLYAEMKPESAVPIKEIHHLCWNNGKGWIQKDGLKESCDMCRNQPPYKPGFIET